MLLGLNLKSFSINFYDFTFGLFSTAYIVVVVIIIVLFAYFSLSLNGSTLTAFLLIIAIIDSLYHSFMIHVTTFNERMMIFLSSLALNVSFHVNIS